MSFFITDETLYFRVWPCDITLLLMKFVESPLVIHDSRLVNNAEHRRTY